MEDIQRSNGPNFSPAKCLRIYNARHKRGREYYSAAAGGLAGRIGQTLEAMAQNMISAGSRQVLLIDEGNDVFQWLNGRYVVMPRRGRIRAVLIFARKKEELKKPEKKNRKPTKTK